MLAIVAGVFGAVVGSFLNVVIYRVPAGLSIARPGSACPHCATPVRPYDNIPLLSWIVLRARCRDCSAPISARYPLVEFATALVFALIAGGQAERLAAASSAAELIASGAVLIALLYFSALSIVLAAIDLDTHRLPNILVLPAYGVVLTLWALAAITGSDLVSLLRALAGAGILFGMYLVLALISPKGMGLGDVKLAGVIGLMLGWFGWEHVAVGALSAFLLGGAFGITLIVFRRASRSSGIPFGPWMLAGAWLGIWFGEPIMRTYLTVVGLN